MIFYLSEWCDQNRSFTARLRITNLSRQSSVCQFLNVARRVFVEIWLAAVGADSRGDVGDEQDGIAALNRQEGCAFLHVCIFTD